MYQVFEDQDGALHIFGAARNAPAARAEGGGRRRRRRDVYYHRNPFQNMQGGNLPIPYYGPTQPMPQQIVQPAIQQAAEPAPSIDMRTALDALGALLPAAGKMIAAFRSPPDKPTLTGQPEKDVAALMEYVAEVFDHQRSGAQTSSVLATTGAVMEILAAL